MAMDNDAADLRPRVGELGGDEPGALLTLGDQEFKIVIEEL